MSKNDYQQSVTEFKKDLSLIETKANGVSIRVEAVTREAESLKIDFLHHLIEMKIISEARQRGMSCLLKDKRRLRNSLLISLSGLVIGGLLTKDKFAAFNTGLSSFNGVLQGLGDARWVVSLGKIISVVPIEEVHLEGQWITWESLKTDMAEMNKSALRGKVLGNFDRVVSELKQESRILVFVVSPAAKLTN